MEEDGNKIQTIIKNNFLAISIIAAALILSGTLIYVFGSKGGTTEVVTGGGGTPTTIPTNPNPDLRAAAAKAPEIGNHVVLGDPKAPVTLIEFGDYQCPFCGRFFNQTEPLIRENYIKTGKVKMVYKDLTIIGDESKAAASAARCASDQGKFWEYHDLLFQTETADNKENSGNLKKDLFLQLARKLNLNEKDFTSCFDSGKHLSEVAKDTEEAGKVLSAPATPSTFVNDRFVQGAVPYSQFASIIDEELRKAK